MTQITDPDLAQRASRAIRRLERTGGVLVALSGGVDSGVLLSLALQALGPDRVLAVTGRSASLAQSDLRDAVALARRLGATHRVVDTGELDRSSYRANRGDRCYHCRTELFTVLSRLARELGFSTVAYGAITDDTGDFRPGMTAARQFRVLAPLLEAGIGKADVRALAHAAGLQVRDKPAGACLASRIPAGTEVTPGRLRQIERAESALAVLGLRQFRVRYHGDVARIELDEEGQRRCFAERSLREAILHAVREAGFRHVALDLDGYRPGSLNPRPLYRIRPSREGGQ